MKTILIALAALAVAAPAARASTISYAPDGALLVTAGPGETNHLGVQAAADDSGRVVIYEGKPGVPLTAPAGGCDTDGNGWAICSWTPAAGVRVDLGDGDDFGYISADLPQTARFAIAGGAGNDRLQASLDGQPTALDGGPGNDELDGGPGADTLTGGDGNDTLDGRAGADHLDGGAGDDLLNGDANAAPAPDVIDGGPGYDRMEADWESSEPAPPVAVTLAGGADDGRPGEGDDVRNVEKVQTHAASRLVGTDAPEYLEVVQVTAASEIDGGGGDDTLRANDGNDHLDGGPGNDDIDAGFGDDTIVGGPGRDRIAGDRRGGDCGPVWCKLPFGNDTIYAQDGEQDSISCGFGEDTVYADPIDVVDSDCEHVTRAGTPAGGGTPTPAGPRLTVSAARAKLASTLAHGLRLRVTAPAAGTLTASARGAAGRATVKRAGATTIVLRFTKAAKRSLAHRRSVKLTVAVHLAPAGLDGSLVVTLKR